MTATKRIEKLLGTLNELSEDQVHEVISDTLLTWPGNTHQ